MISNWFRRKNDSNQNGIRGTVQQPENTIIISHQEDEERKHDRAFCECLDVLENRLHASESTEEIIYEALKSACEFYKAEFSCILIADIKGQAWAPVVSYNRLTGKHISRYTKETESFDGFSRWVSAFYRTEPMIVPDISALKDTNPDEYAHYIRLEVESIIGIPFGQKPTGFFLVKNPTRYQTNPDLARMLAFVSMSTYYLQELQESMEYRDSITAGTDADKTIYISLLGTPEIRIGNKKLDMRNFNARKSWNVMIYLALRKKFVPCRTIAEALYPDTDPSNAEESIRGIVRKLRMKFETVCPDIIVTNEQGYGLNPAYTFSIDTTLLDELRKKVSRERNHNTRLEYLQMAFELYRGNLYNDRCSEQWIISAYHHYCKVYTEVVTMLLDELGTDENYSEIHEYATGALDIMPGITRVYFWLIVSIYMISGYDAAESALEVISDELDDREIMELKESVNEYLKEKNRYSLL